MDVKEEERAVKGKVEVWYEEVWNREKERRVDLRIERRSETKRTKEKEELMIVIGDEIMHREFL